MDTGPIISQLVGPLDPRQATSTELYKQAISLSEQMIKSMLPFLNNKTAPRISQNLEERTTYPKLNWSAWPKEKVSRARTYPYI
jgi:methionyl-tRNA formyltransferase